MIRHDDLRKKNRIGRECRPDNTLCLSREKRANTLQKSRSCVMLKLQKIEEASDAEYY